MVPNFLMVLLTHKCNLNCKYCYLGNKDTIPDNDKVMSFETLSKCFTNLAKEYVKNDCHNSINVQFAGGEPTLLGAELLDKYYTEVERIFKAYEVPYSLAIITNGTTMNQDILNVLMKHSVGTCVSFDGCTNTDRYENENDYQKVLDSIRFIDDSGFSKSIHTVLTDRTKETFLKECSDNIRNYEGYQAVSFVRDIDDNLNLSAEDLLKYYYYPSLQAFIDGKVKNIEGFFNLGPGRFLLRYLTDRFTYHTDRCRTSCGTRYCGGGINLASISPDGYWQMCADFRGDEDFFNGRSYKATDMDFLNLKKIQTNMNYVRSYISSIEKCDNCVHQYYCEHPCMLYIRKKTGKWEIPESKCEITKQLYKWYENHLNSIFKAVYLYCPDHKVKIREDLVYTKIKNMRFDSFYFDLNVSVKNPSGPSEAYLIVNYKG